MSDSSSDHPSFPSPTGSHSIQATNNRQYEMKVVHPATAQWLTEHGYTFRHEVIIEGFGRADFVAVHEDGHKLIVECKNTCENFSSTIRQVKGYQSQLSGSLAAIALPQDALTDYARKVCASFSIHLIALDVPLYEPKPFIDTGVEEAIKRLEVHRSEWGILARDIYMLILQFKTPTAMKIGGELFAYNDRRRQNDLMNKNEIIDLEAWLEALLDKAIDMYREEGKSESWIDSRLRSLFPHNTFTVALLRSLKVTPSLFQLFEIMDTMRIGLWGRDTHQIQQEMGLDSKANVRDHGSEIMLTYEMLAEQVSEYDLREAEDLELDQAKRIVRTDAELIGKQAKVTSEHLGRDIPTGRPLLSARTKRA